MQPSMGRPLSHSKGLLPSLLCSPVRGAGGCVNHLRGSLLTTMGLLGHHTQKVGTLTFTRPILSLSGALNHLSFHILLSLSSFETEVLLGHCLKREYEFAEVQ